MRVLITTNSKHGLCLESVNNMLITTFVNNELITLPTLPRGVCRNIHACARSQDPTMYCSAVVQQASRARQTLAHCLFTLPAL